MIEDLRSLNDDISLETELAVVGAGPAGIVVALEAARQGISVVLLESGNRSFDPAVQELSEAAEWDPHRHAALSQSVRRQVGGTSAIWGGRCVPFDPVDFAPRSYLNVPAWPICYKDVQSYFPRACDWMVCGRAAFSSLVSCHTCQAGSCPDSWTAMSLARVSNAGPFRRTLARRIGNF